MADVFISYSRKDIEKAKQLKAEIEALGISCWMDINGVKNGIASGDEYEEEIMKAIDEAKVVLFFLSNNSMDSQYTKSEVNYAVNENKRMVPVNIDGSKPKGWFYFKYGGRDIVDINNKVQKEKLFNDLKEWFFGDSQISSQSCNETLEAYGDDDCQSNTAVRPEDAWELWLDFVPKSRFNQIVDEVAKMLNISREEAKRYVDEASKERMCIAAGDQEAIEECASRLNRLGATTSVLTPQGENTSGWYHGQSSAYNSSSQATDEDDVLSPSGLAVTGGLVAGPIGAAAGYLFGRLKKK